MQRVKDASKNDVRRSLLKAGEGFHQRRGFARSFRTGVVLSHAVLQSLVVLAVLDKLLQLGKQGAMPYFQMAHKVAVGTSIRLDSRAMLVCLLARVIRSKVLLVERNSTSPVSALSFHERHVN